MGIDPQNTPTSISQVAQDVREQTEMILPDMRKNAIRAYIKYKAYCYQKPNASKVKARDYMYVLWSKQTIKAAKIPSHIFGGQIIVLLRKLYPLTLFGR